MKSYTILTSSNGIDWINRFSQSAGRLQGVEWNGSQYVVVDRSGDIFTSPNGVNWTSQSLGENVNLESVIWDGTQYITVGDSGTVFTSVEGISWTRHGSGETKSFFDVTRGDNGLVAVGQGGIYSSPNGVIWTKRNGEYKGVSGDPGGSNKYSGEKINGKAIVSNWELQLTNSFKGETHVFAVQFEAIKGGRILHLYRGNIEELHLYKTK